MIKLKTIFSWLIGLAFMGFMHCLFGELSKIIGVPVQIYLDEPITIHNHYYDEEVDSLFTGFGYATIFISIMISARIGMAFNTVDFSGGVKKEDEYKFFAWLFGLATYGIGSAILYFLWKDFHGFVANIAFNIMDAGILLAVFVCFKKWLDKNLAAIQYEKPPDKDPFDD